MLVKKKKVASCISALSGVLLCIGVVADAMELKIDDPDIKACLEQSLPEKAMPPKVSLQLFKGSESINTTRAELFWKRGDDGLSKAVIRITAPRDRAGIAVLALERSGGDPDLSVYLPETRKARRVDVRHRFQL
ncbi:MAG: hypothetical protein EXR86_13830 [Gammaproteobacteria bacterium]|nr:hypothetical protein [Gammaproteobacteria bacterium]